VGSVYLVREWAELDKEIDKYLALLKSLEHAKAVLAQVLVRCRCCLTPGLNLTYPPCVMWHHCMCIYHVVV